jgi:hypothetical protein
MTAATAALDGHSRASASFDDPAQHVLEDHPETDGRYDDCDQPVDHRLLGAKALSEGDRAAFLSLIVLTQAAWLGGIGYLAVRLLT